METGISFSFDYILLIIFFLSFRMSKVCRRWREVASEPVLWRKVDLSMSSFQFLRATTATIERLAPTRLTAVTELSLSEWNKLTDKALEVLFYFYY